MNDLSENPTGGKIGRYLVFNIGCIECGVSSNVVGTFVTETEANAVCEAVGEKLDWREGGQNHFEVYDLLAPQANEYREALGADQ